MSMHDSLDPKTAEVLLSRRDAIRGGLGMSSRAAAGLALGSVPVALAALASEAFGQDRALPADVVEVLNFVLMLEEMEVEFYNRGLAAPGLLTGRAREMFDQIRRNETGHRNFLRATLGSRAIPAPRTDFTGGMGRGNGPFGDVFSNVRTFSMLSQAFEDNGVRAGKGQAPNLMRHDMILESALRMHSVEARHASQVRRFRGERGWIVQESPSGVAPQLAGVYEDEDNTFHFILAPLRDSDENTRAFDEPLTKAEVIRNVRPFLADVPELGGRVR